jgi:hypothetical protein
MNHTIVANKSMSITLPTVRGAVDVCVVIMTDGAAKGFVVGDATGDTDGLSEGNIDGESKV